MLPGLPVLRPVPREGGREVCVALVCGGRHAGKGQHVTLGKFPGW